MAIAAVNADPDLLPGTTLIGVFGDETQDDELFFLRSLMEQLLSKDVVAMVGLSVSQLCPLLGERR